MRGATVSFIRSSDGTRLAWSQTGVGPPLVRTGHFMTHIEFEAKNKVFGHWMSDLSARFSYVRYDERGCGLSEREPDVLGEEVWIEDLDAVVQASGFERVALFGMSHGAMLTIAYAAAHPERVSHLVLLGGFATGAMTPGQPEERVRRVLAMTELRRVFWTDPNPAYHEMWARRLMPDGRPEHIAAIDEMQRASSTGDMAADIILNRDEMDVRERAASLGIPTLVAHARDDRVVEYRNGVELATLIPNATLLTLDSSNHLLLDEPAWDVFIAAVTDFVGQQNSANPVPSMRARPSERELEVLRLVALGRSNEEISSRLHLSVRTVERHLANLYRKLGLSGKSARAAAAALLPDLEAGQRSEH